MYLTKWQNVFVQMANLFLIIALVFSSRCICTIEPFNWKKLHCYKCICPNLKMYLPRWQNVLVQMAKCIFLDYQIYVWYLHLSSAAGAFAQLSYSTGRNGIARGGEWAHTKIHKWTHSQNTQIHKWTHSQVHKYLILIFKKTGFAQGQVDKCTALISLVCW